MIKVLIIDDEPLVRMGMKSIIAWEEHGYRIVGEAGNGVQGLEKIFECKPDLVLVDIMMPQMDGLSVIRKARKGGFTGKFIILSCVSEIEYLQKAIRLGVSSYVLKSSVNPQEILETVEEAAEEIKKGKVLPEDFAESFRENTDQFAFREFLNLIFKGVIAKPEELQEKMKVFGFDRRQNVSLIVSSIRDAGRDYRKVLYRMASVGGSMLEEHWGVCLVNFEDYLVLLMSAASWKETEEVLFRLKASAKQYFDVKLQVAEKRIDAVKWNIAEQYEEAKKELSGSFYGDFQENREKEEYTELIPSTEYASYEKLSAALEMMKSMLLQSRAVSEAEAKKVYAGAVEYVILIYELAGQEEILTEFKGAASILEYLNQLDSFEQVHRETLRILQKCYELAEQKGYKGYEDELTDAMIKYIHSHCNSKISTKDVAEHVHFSVDYTCKYFKKKTQTNLTDYILKLKIYRSHKELLEGKSIAEIADIYGFSSGGHYLKVFKKYEGITPGVYVKRKRTEA